MPRIFGPSGATLFSLFVVCCLSLVAANAGVGAEVGSQSSHRQQNSRANPEGRDDTARSPRACFDLEMTSSSGDGWNGARYSVASDGGGVRASGTMTDGFARTVQLCVDDASATYAFEVTSGSRDDGVGWNLGGGALVGGAAETRFFAAREDGQVVERAMPATLAPPPAAGSRTIVQTALCQTTGCNASTTFSIPGESDALAKASLSVSVGGDLGPDSLEVLNIEVNGQVVATCGGWDNECNDPFETCVSNLDVLEAALTGRVTVALAAGDAVNALCSYNDIAHVAAIIEATLVLDESSSPGDKATLSPTFIAAAPTQVGLAWRVPRAATSASAPFRSIANVVAATPEPTPFSMTRTLVQTALCRTPACTASLAFNISEEFGFSDANLSISVGGDLGSSSEVLEIAVNGVHVETCGGFGNDCNDPLASCVSNLDVVAFANMFAIEVSFQASRDVGNICEYEGFNDVAAIVEANLTLTLSDTDFPTPLPTHSPAPTTNDTNAPSAMPTPVPTPFPLALTQVQTAFCRTTGCSAVTTFNITDDFVFSSANLSVLVGGDLGDSLETLSITVNDVLVGACGGFGEDCNDPLVTCVSNLDVIDAALTGIITVGFETSFQVENVCSYEEFADGLIAAIMQATLTVALVSTPSPSADQSLDGASYSPTNNPTYMPTVTPACSQASATSPFESIASEPSVMTLEISANDDETEEVELPFDFPWFSSNVTSVVVSTNGQLNMDGSRDSNCCAADPISPDSSAYSGDRIAFAQEDLSPLQGGSIYFLNKVGSSVISFEGVPFFSNAGEVNAQVELFSSGLVELRWGSGSTAGKNMAAGLQSDAESVYAPVVMAGGAAFANGVTAFWPAHDGVTFTCTSIPKPPTIQPTAAPFAQLPTQTPMFSGFLVDLLNWNLPNHIALDGADLANSPEDFTVHAMRDIQEARDSGFGILVEQANATFNLDFVFDSRGNQLALEVLDQTSIFSGLRVGATATLTPSIEIDVLSVTDLCTINDGGCGP